MKRIMYLLLFLIFVLILCACTKQSENQKSDLTTSNKFTVYTEFSSHVNIPDYYMHDIEIPFVSSSAINAGEINKQIEKDYKYVMIDYESDLHNTCIPLEGYKYTWIKYGYEISNIDGICSMTIIKTISSAYGSFVPQQSLHSYYYDEKTGSILNKDQYLDKIGYQKEDIINALVSEHCPAAKKEEINFSNIMFYFDHNNELKIIFQGLDYLK